MLIALDLTAQGSPSLVQRAGGCLAPPFERERRKSAQADQRRLLSSRFVRPPAIIFQTQTRRPIIKTLRARAHFPKFQRGSFNPCHDLEKTFCRNISAQNATSNCGYLFMRRTNWKHSDGLSR